MADVKRQVDTLIGLLNQFAGESDEAKNALEQFGPILDSFVKGKVVSDWGSLATAINSVSVALTNLGVSGIGIDRIRTDLQKLAAEYRYFGGQFATKGADAIEAPATGMLSNLPAIRAQREALVKSRIASQITSPDELANIRAQQDAQYAAARQQAINTIQSNALGQKGEIFDKEIESTRRWQEEIEKVEAAYRKTAAYLSTVTPPEQVAGIRAKQDAEYEAARQEAIRLPGEGPAGRLFEPNAPKLESSVEMTQQQAEWTRRLNEEVQKLEQAYDRTYSGRLKIAREEALELTKREATVAASRSASRKAEGREPVDLGIALKEYEGFIPGGEVGIQNLQARLEALGVTQVDNVQASRELSNGITTMSVRMTETSGAVTRGTVHMDRFGNVLRDTSRRFRSFSDAIGTNIIKVTQWAVATGVVYGIVRQLGQVLKEITEIQSKLASVQIALGVNQGDLNRVFEEALNIANLTSSSVAGVVEAYALAFRATGAYSDEAERLVVTNMLLQESMILAELAGIDQATALDTLVGALRQTGLELDEGRDLLDKWVYVSRQANVSLDTLAQTYSIVGTSAKGVGIEIEELNALSATLAEATGLSATETGNAIRGIIAGFQSASSQQTLARFGIATRDATGQLRDFFDLYLEIGQLTQSGVLSDRDITEIANAIGGGYRRGAQVETLLKNNQRVVQLTRDQSEAGGAATEALGIQMATLESAITRLGNAFTKFAQTLGDEGGFLELITSIVNGMTSVLTVISQLVGGLGKATPAVLAFAAAWTVLGTAKGQDLFKGVLNLPAGRLLTGAAGRAGLGASASQQLIASRLALYGGGVAAAPQSRLSVAGAFGGIRGGLQARLGGLNPLGLIAPALIAGSAVKSGIETGDKSEFGRAATSVVGAIVGGLITAGNPLGIAAGSAMASAFYQGMLQYEDDLAGWWAAIIREGADKADDEEDGPAAAIEDSFKFGAKAFAGISSIIGTVGTFLAPTGQDGLFGTGIGSREGQADLDPRAFLTGLAMQQQGEIPPQFRQAFVDLLIDEETGQAVMDALNASLVDAELEGTGISDAIAGSIEGLKEVVGPVLEDFINDMQKELVLGDISLPEFIKIPQTINVTNLATQLAKITTAADFSGMTIDVEEFSRFLLELDEATRQYIVTLADDVVSAQNAYNKELELNGATTERAIELQEILNERMERYADLLPSIEQQAELAAVPRSAVFEVGRATPQQAAMAVTLAKEFQRAYFLALADGNEELADLMEEQVEPILLKYGEELGQRFGESVAVGAQYLTEAFSTLGFDELLSDVKFSFQDLRDSLGLEDIPDLMSRYQKVVGTFQTFFPEYDIEEQDVGLITKNGLTTVHADLTLLNLAMQDLIDVNEQQLEGVWNIPQGMTAMVAWSSLFSRNLPTGGDVFAGDDVFTEDRGPEAGTEAVNIEAQIKEITERILGLQNVLSKVTSQDIGSPAFDAMTAELASLQAERTELLDRLSLQQFATGVGIESPEANLLDQFRDALTIQNKVEFNTNIRLVVDGRTLANIVKQYLFEDLAAASDKVSGTGGGNYVIE